MRSGRSVSTNTAATKTEDYGDKGEHDASREHDRFAPIPGSPAAARVDGRQDDPARCRGARGVSGTAAQIRRAVREAAAAAAGAGGAGDSAPLRPRLPPDPASDRAALLVGLLPAIDAGQGALPRQCELDGAVRALC